MKVEFPSQGHFYFNFEPFGDMVRKIWMRNLDTEIALAKVFPTIKFIIVVLR